MAEMLSILNSGRALLPRRLLVLISVRGWVDLSAILRLGLGKNGGGGEINNIIGNRTRDFPAYRITPQPIMLPRAPLDLRPTPKFFHYEYVHDSLLNAIKATHAK
jgi:hypothetical protein